MSSLTVGDVTFGNTHTGSEIENCPRETPSASVWMQEPFTCLTWMFLQTGASLMNEKNFRELNFRGIDTKRSEWIVHRESIFFSFSNVDIRSRF